MRKIPYEKLADIAEIVLPKVLSRIIVDTDGGYLLFNEYFIKKNIDNYYLIRRGDEKEFVFTKLKNAITYAILHKNFKMYEASRVYELDNLLDGLSLEQKLYQKYKKKKKLDDYVLHWIKLQNVFDKHNKFTDELDKYIIVAKDCQQKGFENEINRTKRK